MKLQSRGTWSVRSESDPRWDGWGTADVGGFMMPDEAKQHIKEKQKELGKKPDDLTWSYMKD